MELSARALFSLILVLSVTSLMASTGAIGFAAANGTFQVNTEQAQGTATLFDGSVVETQKAPSLIRLSNGAEFRLATDSRAKVYEARIVLEKGAGQLESSSAYPIESRSLRVYSTEPNTIARVTVSDQGRVLVATLRGTVRVANSGGFAVANVVTGLSMAFDPQVGASAPAKLSGCLFESNGKSFIFDGATKVAHGLSGSGMTKYAGKNVEITGIENPTTHLINVTSWKQLPTRECDKFAKVAKESGVETAAKTVGVGAAAGAGAGADAGAAAGTAAGAAAGGMGVAATVAVIGGVAAASTVGGLAASGSFSGSNTPTTPNPATSR